MIKKTQLGIWETDVKDLDLTNPRVLKWYMEKKIHLGDWEALDRKTLGRLLPSLEIEPSIRTLLEGFFALSR